MQYSEKIVAKVMNIAKRQYGNIYKNKSGVAVEARYNSGQMVFEINFNGGEGQSGFVKSGGGGYLSEFLGMASDVININKRRRIF